MERHNIHNNVYEKIICLLSFNYVLPNDVAWDFIIILFISGNCIGILFWENGVGHLQNGCNFFMIRCNG